MKRHRVHLLSVFAGFMFAASVFGQTTAFKYQGSLTDGGSPANGNFQMQFRLFDAASGGTQIGSTLSDLPVTAANGIFTISLDFGSSALSGANRWLEIAMRRNSGESYVTLSPREQISSAPYSVRTLSAAQADTALDSQKLGGINAGEYVTTSTVGGSFIRNDTAPQTANFNVVGNGVIGTQLGVGKPVAPGMRIDSLGVVRSFDSISTHFLAETTGGTNAWARFFMKTPGRQWSIGTSNNFNGNQFYLVDDTLGQLRMTIQPAGGAISFPFGHVGIGSTSPSLISGGTGRLLEISDPNSPGLALRNTQTGGNQYFLYSGAFGTTGSGFLGIFDATNNANRLVINNNGNVGIGTTNPTARLDVAGLTKTGVLQITGGSDVAENFEIDDAAAVKPGMVVAIDPNKMGKLVLARGAYNRQVVGVVSGANGLMAGLLLPNPTDSETVRPIALSGRAWVYSDARKGPIRPGDMLTTSDLPGHAMRAVKIKRARGAVIGKAMTALSSGTGLVLVFVTLQ